MYVQMKVTGSFEGVIHGTPEEIFAELLEIRKLLSGLPIDFTMTEELLEYAEGGPQRFNDRPVDEVLIDELELGVRTYNCLKREGIRTIGALLEKTEAHLRGFPNLGDGSFNEIIENLHARGLSLRTETE